jgi:hypothetical protein
MSDTSQGPGWWRASDNRWYPPEQHPDYVPPPDTASFPPPPDVPPLGPPSLVPGQAPLYGPPSGPGHQGPDASHRRLAAPPGFPPWSGRAVPVTSGMAIAGLILSILWIGGLGSVAAVVLGAVALSQIRSSQGRTQGRGVARAAFVIGIVGVVGSIALYATVGADTGPLPSAHADGLVPSTVLHTLTDEPSTVVSAVGVPPQSVVTPPALRVDQPPLVIDGHPGAVFIGGEFCPYCAAERWAIIMAFSRFGSFSDLREMASSRWDVYPSTATFTFHGATYSSRYIALDMAEHSGNDVDGPGTFSDLDPLTTQEANLWQKYDDSYGYPFLDIGNKVLVLSPSFSPALLSGFDQRDIASRLSDPDDPSTQGIVGTANYLTAAICMTTGQEPATVCSSSVVRRAGQAMKANAGASLTAQRGWPPG